MPTTQRQFGAILELAAAGFWEHIKDSWPQGGEGDIISHDMDVQLKRAMGEAMAEWIDLNVPEEVDNRKVYRAKFSRLNFTTSPALEQTADVIVETDIPLDNEHLAEFEHAIWSAMWLQTKWNDTDVPVKGFFGWSSPRCDGKYVEVT